MEVDTSKINPSKMRNLRMQGQQTKTYMVWWFRLTVTLLHYVLMHCLSRNLFQCWC